MSEADPGTEADAIRAVLRVVAVQAALVSAAVHLLWAVPRLASPPDVRPYLFVPGALFTLAIAIGVYHPGEYRRLYALGMGTLATFVVGFLIQHRGAVVVALTADPLAVVGKAAEIVGVGVFLTLYLLAPPTRAVLDGKASATDDGVGDGADET